MGDSKSAGLRAAGVAAIALLATALAGPAAAQTPAGAADALKFPTNSPVHLLIQVNPDKASDFEAAWAGIKAGFAKSENADHKAFSESLTKLFKVDQPPVPGPSGAPMLLYILQLDSPSTAISYDPYKMIWEQLWKPENSILTRPEADALFEKLKGSLLGVNLWKLIKVSSTS